MYLEEDEREEDIDESIDYEDEEESDVDLEERAEYDMFYGVTTKPWW